MGEDARHASLNEEIDARVARLDVPFNEHGFDRFGISRDTRIYIPFATYKKRFGVDFSGAAYAPQGSLVVFVQTESPAQLEAAEDQVRAIMRNRRGKSFKDEDDGFALETQDVFLDLYSKATSNIYLVTIGVSAISLVVLPRAAQVKHSSSRRVNGPRRSPRCA